MQIYGLNKTTLLDYPGHLACTVFTGGCNFRCPFCHNADLVLNPSSQPIIPEEEFFAFLKKRSGILEGVCITGGEPLLHKDLSDFIRRIRSMNLLVKLDTNGYLPDKLEALLQEGLLDYVAMDIKSSRAGYPAAAGLTPDTFDYGHIAKSISLLMHSGISYEFRTTVVADLHTAEDFDDIAEIISGCTHYYLQSYEEKESILLYRTNESATKLSSFSPDELRALTQRLNEAGIPTSLRGI